MPMEVEVGEIETRVDFVVNGAVSRVGGLRF